jgi:hypothetical protein
MMLDHSLQRLIFLFLHVTAINSFRSTQGRQAFRSISTELASFVPKNSIFTQVVSFRSISTELASFVPKNSIFTQVVSDVDDTLKSSGGVNVGGVALGGIDVQYERGDLYPGVAEFMLEISRHGISKSEATVPPKVAILTARAEEFKVALEIKDDSSLAVAMRVAGEKAGIANWGGTFLILFCFCWLLSRSSQ